MGALGSLAWVAVTASLVASAAAFAPWHRSGERVRNGVDLLAVADEIGLLQGTGWAALRVGWAVLPLLAGAALVAAVAHHQTLAMALAGAAGAQATMVGLAGTRLPGAQWGPSLALLTGLVAAAAAAIGLGLVYRARR